MKDQELLKSILDLVPQNPNNYTLGEKVRELFVQNIGYEKYETKYKNKSQMNLFDSEDRDDAVLGYD